MLDTTADTWYTWVGLVAASLAVGGVVAGLPAAAPPEVGPVAETVDDVAASPYTERESVTVPGRELRLGTRQLALRSEGGTAHASFARPVTPVRAGRLTAVLRGTPPGRVYTTPAAFDAALQAARDREARWQPAPDRLTVRRVSWGGVDATLVG